MSLIYAKIRLAEWGQWSRDKSLGYPHASAGFGDRGSPEVLSQSPPHIELVDVIVRQMQEVDIRRALIVTYTQSGTRREKAGRLNEAYSTYCRMLKQGQEHVGIELDMAETYCAVGQVVAHSA